MVIGAHDSLVFFSCMTCLTACSLQLPVSFPGRSLPKMAVCVPLAQCISRSVRLGKTPHDTASRARTQLNVAGDPCEFLCVPATFVPIAKDGEESIF